MADIDTQSAEDTRQLQPPGSSPTPVAPSVAPAAPPQAAPENLPLPKQAPVALSQQSPLEQPGSFFTKLGHSFAGALLGTLAGNEKVTGYTTDPAGKTSPIVEKMSTGDQIRQIAKAALTGLAAGASVPQQKSGLASGLAGLGAGTEAEIGQQKQEDLLKRAQASQQFEQEQKAQLQKYEIARNQALTFSTYTNAMQAQEDHDPVRQHNLAIAQAVEQAHIPGVQYMDADKAMQMVQNNPQMLQEYAIKPIGFKTDPNLLDENGVPKKIGQVALIPGLSNEEIKLPQNVIDEAKAYAPVSGLMTKEETDKLQAGMPIPVNQLITLDNAILEGRKQSQVGWQKPEVSFQEKDGEKVPVQFNPYAPEGQQIREFPNGIVPKSVVDTITDQNVKASVIKSNLANASLHDAQAKQALADANMIEGMIGTPAFTYTPPPNILQTSANDVAADLKSKGVTVPPNFDALYAVGHYDMDLKDFTSRVYKGMPQMSRDMAASYVRRFINPTYDEKNYVSVQNMEKEFASSRQGTAGGNLIAFNTATGHLGQLYTAADALQNGDIQVLNRVANTLGVQTGLPAVPEFNAIKTALVGELGKTFKGASPDIPEQQEILNTLSAAQSPEQIKGTARTYAHLMLTKAQALASHYRSLTGKYPNNLIEPAAQDVYQKLGIPVDLESAGPTSTTGIPLPTYKATATGPNGHKIGTNDGATWYDIGTGQPLTQAPPTQTPPTGAK